METKVGGFSVLREPPEQLTQRYAQKSVQSTTAKVHTGYTGIQRKKRKQRRENKKQNKNKNFLHKLQGATEIFITRVYYST